MPPAAGGRGEGEAPALPARAHLRARRPARLRATARGQHHGPGPAGRRSTRDDLYVDLLFGDEGRALLYLPFLNYFDGNLDAAAEMIAHPHTVPGLSDGGAHVGTICDASFPTSLLTHWGRDRARGTTFALPFLVQRQSRATAEAVGLLDRGLLAPGYKADVNVIDFEHLDAHSAARWCTTCPPAASVWSKAHGATCTPIVSGVETYTDGQPTGALPGRFVRGEQPPPSPGGIAMNTIPPPRSSRPQCEWTSTDVADEELWTERFDDTEQAELDGRPAPRPGEDRTTCSSSGCDDFPLPTLHGRLPSYRGRAHQRARVRPTARRRPPGLYAGGDGDHLLGHRHPPRAAVGPEQVRPRARRRHRPAQGHRRSDGARQRARRYRPALPLRRLRPGRPHVPRERPPGWIVRRGQLGAHPQSAGVGATRPRRRALRRPPERLPGRAGGRRQALLPGARLHRVGETDCSCAAFRPTSSRRNAIRRLPV